ncbi:MAG: hypothetical protein KY460_06990 [Actinobacteria bacterium]|nr:hypothetical protein [Actinomycetota bacterium]
MSQRWRPDRWAGRAAVALCAVLLAGCGVAPDASGGAAATPPVDRAVDAVQTPGPAVAAGTAVGLRLPPAPDGELRAVAVADEHVVVAGAGGGDNADPAAWSPNDDGTWRSLEIGSEAGVPRLDAVAHDGSSGVAFGGDGAGPSQAWVTGDLDAWQPADTGVDGRVGGVAASGDRWIAVGDRVDPEGGEAYEGMVWISENGASFEVLADDLALAEGTLTDVAVAGETIVVVGFDVTGGAVWTSSDGDAFVSVAGPFDGATIDGVAATDKGFVALGRGLADLAVQAWTSVDGSRWERVDVTGGELQPQHEIHDVTSVNGMVIAVGGTPQAGAIWHFEDGRLARVGS